jgi:hypothetical protein
MTATVTLAHVGPVRALPDEYTPVANTGRQIRSGRCGVIVWTGPEPFLTGPSLDNMIVAGAHAVVARAVYHTDRIFVVRHPAGAVTVHGGKPDHPGHLPLLGTMLVDDDPPRWVPGAVTEWHRILYDAPGAGPVRREHMRLVAEAQRRAHQLPRSASGADVAYAVLAEPMPAIVYLRAYLNLLFDPAAVHEHAERAHRRERTHRRPGPDTV